MLIRGPSTEQRIAEIAQRFGQGLGDIGKSMTDQANVQNNANAQMLQMEARKRQEALQTIDVANNLAEKTGKLISPEQISPLIKSGDFSGLGQLLKEAPTNPKFEREQARLNLQDDALRARIAKDNRAAASRPKENLTYAEKLQMKTEAEAAAKASERNNPATKLEGLGAEGRSKVGAIASGFQSLDQMLKASEDGHGPQYVDSNTPIAGAFVSDNPYSSAERVTNEVIGRLQSGGAIGKEEEQRFKAMGPRPGDDKATRATKLQAQMDFLKNKLTAYGLNHEELGKLGFELTSKYQPKAKSMPQTVIQNGHTYTLNPATGKYE